MPYTNNTADFVITHVYDGAEHEELLKFFTKELNALGNLGGPSSSSIEFQIKQLQEELIKARKREDIENLLQEYDLDIHTMPDSENVGRTICFIGQRDEFFRRFVIPEREQMICEE